MPALSARERQLTEELDEANETIRHLRLELTPISYLHHGLSGFTKSQAALLVCLSDGKVHTWESLRLRLDIVNRRRAEGTIHGLGMVTVGLRRKLAGLPLPTGVTITIETHHGVGYSMSAQSIANLKALATPPSS